METALDLGKCVGSRSGRVSTVSIVATIGDSSQTRTGTGVAARSRSTSTRRRILPDGRLRDLLDELQSPHLFVRRDPCGDVCHQVLRCGLAPQHDERLRHLAGLLVRAGDHGDIGDRRVSQQHRFQFGRGHLVRLVLDQFLEPVDDVEPAVGIGVADVTCVQPAVGVDRCCAVASGRLR